ncbi:polyamine aminopropyltransferase [Orenia marismortui]|uniref:polyamine aminopropyltransferase n=1 Tax=Orenia marismortui TaxID=46469 RepID=UPI00035CB827|nr:polyamine aminopropyltransferase [Orenia marismortui]
MKEKKLEDIKIVAPLMFCTFFVAISGIVYQLIIGGISSYLLGNSIYQFSITIGLFMTSMGLGSLVSKYIEVNLMGKFMIIETLLGLVGGISGFLLFYSYALSDIYLVVMYGLILVIGSLTGLELPLLTRIIEKYEDLKITLANVFSVDYIGGLIGSILFPIILLPNFGFIQSSYIMGILNLVVAAIVYIKYHKRLNLSKTIGMILTFVIIILIIGITNVKDTEAYIEQKLYQDKVIYSEQTKYQKIVVTKKKDDIRLFLNGNIQFSSHDEYRYHESLVHPAMSLAKNKSRVLILGGGDGLAVRELLKYSTIEMIDLVDLDQRMTDLAQNLDYLVELNQNSLQNEKVSIYNQDAYQYLEESSKKYDVVIVDLPDPNDESLNKLYTSNFYHLIYDHLGDKGVVVVQSTSPYFATKSFWMIHHTIKSSGFYTLPYHTYLASFGDWGFNLGTKGFRFNPLELKVEVATKFLTTRQVASLFEFGQDILEVKEEVGVNTLTRPRLIREYNRAWEDY